MSTSTLAATIASEERRHAELVARCEELEGRTATAAAATQAAEARLDRAREALAGATTAVG